MSLAAEGIGLFNAGRFEAALAKFLLARGQGPPPPHVELFIGHCLRSLGRRKEAVAIFRALGHGKRKGLFSASCLAQAAVLKQEGRLGKATVLLEDALKRNPREARLSLSLAEILRERLLEARALDQTDKASFLLERILTLNPSDGDARLELGFLLHKRAQGLLEKGSLEKARALLKRLLNLAPHRLDLKLELASLLVKTGEISQAAQLLTQALLRARRSSRSSFGMRKRLEDELGRAYWARYDQLKTAGKLGEAESLLRRFLRLGVERARARLELISLLGQRERFGEAMRLLRAERRKPPPMKSALRGLALSLAKGLGESLRRECSGEPSSARSRAVSSILENIQRLIRSKLLDKPSLESLRKEAQGSLLSWARKLAVSDKTAEALKFKRLLLRGSIEETQKALQLFSDEYLGRERVADSQRLLRAAWKKFLGSDSRPSSPLGFSLLTALGRYEAAFALAEGLLDKGATLAEARTFSYPWWSTRQFDYCQARHRDILATLAAAGRFPPWAHFYEGLLRAPGPGSGDFEKLKDYPQERYGWMHLRAGWARLVSADFGKAVEHLEWAKKSRPADWRAWAFQAEAHLCLGNRDKALGTIQEAAGLAAAEERPDAVAWKGLLLLWLGEYQAALEAAEEACRGQAQWAICWRGAAKVKMGRIPEALEDFDRALRRCPEDREASLWRAEAKRLLGRFHCSLRDLSREPIGLWARINRALAWDALGSERAMLRETKLIDEDVLTYAASRCGLALPSAPTRAQARQILEAALSASRGYRKERGYGDHVWMQGCSKAGAP